jgi:hypothetical protein
VNSDRPGRVRVALVTGGYALLLLSVFHRAWGAGGPASVFGWDCLREYWPDLVFQANALADGELPLWNPHALGGYPFYGDPQTGLFSPVNWLLWLAAWLSGSTGPWLIVVKVFLYLWLGMVGMHLLVARRTSSELAAAAAAIVYLLGSPLLVHKNSSLLWPMLLLPWLILALDRLWAVPDRRRAAALALALWACGSAGSPHGFFFALLVIVPYGAFRLLARPREAPGEIRRTAPWIALAGGISLLLLLGTFLPAAQVVDATPRADRGLDYVLQGSLAWRDLGELLAPNLDTNWMKDIYLGPLCLVAALVAVALARPGTERRERLFWLALAAFSILCALGQSGGVLAPLADHAPGFGLFRIAYRYKMITAFALAVLAGDGVAAVLRGSLADRRRWIAIGLTGAWLLAMFAVVTGILPAGEARPESAAPIFALLFGGSSVMLLMAAGFVPRLSRWLAVGALTLALIDLWIAGQSKVAILQPPPARARDTAVLAKLGGPDPEYRYAKRGVLGDHAAIVHGRRELTGYPNPFVLARMDDVIARAPRSVALLRQFNVRWWLGSRPPPGGGAQAIGPGVYQLDDPVPVARVYYAVEMLPARRILDRLARAPAPEVALIDPADAGPIALSGALEPPGDGRVIHRRRNRVEVEIEAKHPGVLVLNESYFAGWNARVDGASAPVFRANYALRGVSVPAGARRVVFEFAPPGLSMSLVGFALGLILLCGAAAPWRRAKLRPRLGP